MKRFALAVAIVMVASIPASAQEVLTNETVVTLVGAGLGVDTIVAKVRASASAFDVSTAKLIELKQRGVPDPVIAAMVDASGRSRVSARAVGSSDSPDPYAPHAAGVYMLASWQTPPKMLRMDATSTNQTKTGGFLGYALTSGIAKIKIKAVIPGANARISTTVRRPVFYFYFDQATTSLSGGAPSGFWLGGGTVTSPNEFSMVRFDVKSDHREAAVGQFNIGGANAGVQDKQRVSFTYEDVSPGVFKIIVPQDLPPGEYGFLYSSSTGGGVGMYSGGATTSRIFDFSIKP